MQDDKQSASGASGDMCEVPAPDWNRVADVLGIARSTLPPDGEHLTPHDREEPRLESKPPFAFTPLSDDEWAAVQMVMPKLPVPKPSPTHDDHKFITACLWYISAKSRGLSWQRLPEELGPLMSRQNRHLRWCLLGYWRDLFNKLKDDARISPGRLRAFELLAIDSETRRKKVLDRRMVEAGAR